MFSPIYESRSTMSDWEGTGSYIVDRKSKIGHQAEQRPRSEAQRARDRVEQRPRIGDYVPEEEVPPAVRRPTVGLGLVKDAADRAWQIDPRRRPEREPDRSHHANPGQHWQDDKRRKGTIYRAPTMYRAPT